jgi:GNAT superfamily N-acetyltransferase
MAARGGIDQGTGCLSFYPSLAGHYGGYIVEQGAVWGTVKQANILGVLVLSETDEGFCIETIAVRPSAQGLGIGRQLLTRAEMLAKQSGYSSLYLSTHRLMDESQAVHGQVGYVEFDRRTVKGYDRIFVRKQLL